MQKFIYQPPAGDPTILYQDQDIIAINKPSGLLSNPGRAPETLDCALTRLQKTYPQSILIHRLDCETSGILVFALNKKAERSLKIQFQERQVLKRYLARVNGQLEHNSGVIELPLGADKHNIPLQKVDFEQGKTALTRYKVLSSSAHSSFIQLDPKTGRTHQLRVHMKALGHTILGDNFYANDAVKNAYKRLCLHASELTFEHPSSNKTVYLHCPADF